MKKGQSVPIECRNNYTDGKIYMFANLPCNEPVFSYEVQPYEQKIFNMTLLTPIKNDELNAVIVPPDGEIEIFEHEDAKGSSMILGAGYHDLNTTFLKDKASSFIVKKRTEYDWRGDQYRKDCCNDRLEDGYKSFCGVYDPSADACAPFKETIKIDNNNPSELATTTEVEAEPIEDIKIEDIEIEEPSNEINRIDENMIYYILGGFFLFVILFIILFVLFM